MHIKKAAGKMLFLLALMAPAAPATTIVEGDGNSTATLPLGFYAPYVQYGYTPTVGAVGWHQNNTFQNIDVTATLFIAGGGETLNYELVNAIGPGTSFAANGVTRGTVNFTDPFNVIRSADLFQLPSLGPGNYFLVLDSPTPGDGWIYGYPTSPAPITAPGVSFISSYAAFGPSVIDSAYTPASSFNGINTLLEFSVTGTEAGAPEPSTAGLLILGVACLLVARRRG